MSMKVQELNKAIYILEQKRIARLADKD